MDQIDPVGVLIGQKWNSFVGELDEVIVGEKCDKFHPNFVFFRICQFWQFFLIFQLELLVFWQMPIFLVTFDVAQIFHGDTLTNIEVLSSQFFIFQILEVNESHESVQ
jgi:hypothetical protein